LAFGVAGGSMRCLKMQTASRLVACRRDQRFDAFFSAVQQLATFCDRHHRTNRI
jgi:hypothetical protein